MKKIIQLLLFIILLVSGTNIFAQKYILAGLKTPILFKGDEQTVSTISSASQTALRNVIEKLGRRLFGIFTQLKTIKMERNVNSLIGCSILSTEYTSFTLLKADASIYTAQFPGKLCNRAPYNLKV